MGSEMCIRDRLSMLSDIFSEKGTSLNSLGVNSMLVGTLDTLTEVSGPLGSFVSDFVEDFDFGRTFFKNFSFFIVS